LTELHARHSHRDYSNSDFVERPFVNHLQLGSPRLAD
jgi:hypothetical protein